MRRLRHVSLALLMLGTIGFPLTGCGSADRKMDAGKPAETSEAQDARAVESTDPVAVDQPEDGITPRETEAIVKSDPRRRVELQASPKTVGDPRRSADAPEDEMPRMAFSFAPESADENPSEMPAGAEPLDDLAPASAAATSAPDSSTVEETPPTTFTMKTVFYATDRKAKNENSTSPLAHWGIVPAGAGALVTIVFLGMGLFGVHRSSMLCLAAFTFLVTACLGTVCGYDQYVEFRRYAKPDVEYGNDRGQLEMGTCQVSIPKSHTTGELESPSILRLEVREDVNKHVILQQTRRDRDDQFFDKLRQSVQTAQRPEVFVFVHGYNVTFDDAARRTAQIAHDVDFSGAPMFFSWPSQGGLLQYTVDETNIEWAVPHLKQFLLDVVQESGAKSVSLVAHSMGSRGLSRALYELSLEMREQKSLFNQVILAAPDVDAEVFRRDLAPALIRSSERVTLYASSNDQALAASKKVHGYARAGDSGSGLVVLPGIDTIDVSTIKTSLLGHSYYGSSNPILKDLQLLMLRALPADQRLWLRAVPHDGLTYWVFQHAYDTAAGAADPTR